MLQLIIGILILLFLLDLIKKILNLAKKLAMAIFVVIVVVLSGVPVTLGIVCEKKLFGILRLRLLIGILFCISSLLIFVSTLFGSVSNISAGSFTSIKYALPAFLFIFMLVQHRRRVADQKLSDPIKLFQEIDIIFYRYYFSTFFIVSVAGIIESKYNINNVWLFWIYWVAGVIAQLVCINDEYQYKSLLNNIYSTIFPAEKLNITEYLEKIKTNSEIGSEKIDAIFYGILVNLQKSITFDELELNDQIWIFNKKWHKSNIDKINIFLQREFRVYDESVNEILENHLKLSQPYCNITTRFTI